MCFYCQSFGYDLNSCTYYDIFDESCATLNATTEIMNEQCKYFVSVMQECDILHGTDSNLPFFRLVSSLYNDCESSLPLEFNFVDDVLLTNLEEMFDPTLTSLPLVAPSFSSTHLNTSISDLTLLSSPFPLAQRTRLDMDELSRGNASVIEDYALAWSKKLALVEPYLEEALLKSYVVTK